LFFGGKYQLKRRPREMYKYILMCAAASAVCLCVCVCVLYNTTPAPGVFGDDFEEIDRCSSSSSISLYSVCSCMFLTLFLLFDGYIKLWRNCCCETNVDVGFYSYVWTSTPKDSLDEFLLSTSKYKKGQAKSCCWCCALDEIRNISIGLLIFSGEKEIKEI
jgi:hypothetical protein